MPPVLQAWYNEFMTNKLSTSPQASRCQIIRISPDGEEVLATSPDQVEAIYPITYESLRDYTERIQVAGLDPLFSPRADRENVAQVLCLDNKTVAVWNNPDGQACDLDGISTLADLAGASGLTVYVMRPIA